MALAEEAAVHGAEAAANHSRQELETAKEILAEVFGGRPFDAEEVVQLQRCNSI